jgi:hypothetical protein
MTANQYILSLIETFPCLRHKGVVKHFAGRPFNADLFLETAGPWSSGERRCALFIVNVWDAVYAKEKGWTFDLFDACSVLDDGNRAAIIAWIKAPRFP